jgi:hypothetical protein
MMISQLNSGVSTQRMLMLLEASQQWKQSTGSQRKRTGDKFKQKINKSLAALTCLLHG